MADEQKIYLVGNPNSGKTTLFNYFTGKTADTGNYEGVTVSKKEGEVVFEGTCFKVIDLPGTYSLNPRTEEEKEAVNYINQIQKGSKVFFIADLHSLSLQLFLLSQLLEKDIEVVLVLNQIHNPDQVKLNQQELEDNLGIPIFLFDKKQKDNLELFKLKAKGRKETKEKTTLQHYEQVNTWLKNAEYQVQKWSKTYEKLNWLVTHPVLGLGIFFILMYGVFQLLFSFADYPIAWIESIFSLAGEYVRPLFSGHWMGSLIVDGFIAGLAGVVVFVPQITLLFFFLELFNQSGYLPRTSYLMDGLMKKMGLSGKSVIPMISSYACAVPAIMATRGIKSRKERLISIFILPFITCSARLPVYVLIISLVIPSSIVFGVFNMQSIVLFGLYILGLFASIVSALIIGSFIKSDEPNYFMMQMPRYRIPEMKQVIGVVWIKVKDFLFEAGKYILLASMVLWLLGNIGSEKAFYNGESPAIQESYLGQMGKVIEPVIKPLGYDWKIGISIISSFAAREVFVGTMATIYGLEEENEQGIIESMKTDHHSDGKIIYNLATGLSLLLFYAFSLQCVSTIAIVKRETGGWKWPIIQLVFMSALGYFSALGVYQFFS